MGEQEQEDTFLINAALGTDLLTSAASATGDDDTPKCKGSGCLSVVLLIVAGIVAWVIVRAVGF